MAKITMEDCLEVVPNRFNLTIMAANRARELLRGEKAVIEVREGEKPSVTALREIASGRFTQEKLDQLLIAGVDKDSIKNKAPRDSIGIPNETTKKAMKEAESGNCQKFNTVDELMTDLKK